MAGSSVWRRRTSKTCSAFCGGPRIPGMIWRGFGCCSCCRARDPPMRGGFSTVENPPRIGGSRARQQLQHPKPRQIIPGILGPPQNAEHVFDVRRLQKLEPAIFHERDIVTTELDLEQIGVMRGAHEHRLAAQGYARLPMREHAFYYIVRLPLLVLRRDERRLVLRPPL